MTVWILAVTLSLSEASGGGIATLYMKDGQVYASKRACEKSPAAHKVQEFYEKIGPVFDIACVSQRVTN